MSDAILSQLSRAMQKLVGEMKGLRTDTQSLTSEVHDIDTQVRDLGTEVENRLQHFAAGVADIFEKEVAAFEARVAALQAENEKLHARIGVVEEITANHEAALITLGKDPCPGLFATQEPPEQEKIEITTEIAPEPVLIAPKMPGTPIPPVTDEMVHKMTRHLEYARARENLGY